MFEEQENNIVLNENSVEIKPCINIESKSNELTIKVYSCQDINMKFLVVVTPPSIYQYSLYYYPHKDTSVFIPPLFVFCNKFDFSLKFAQRRLVKKH